MPEQLLGKLLMKVTSAWFRFYVRVAWNQHLSMQIGWHTCCSLVDISLYNLKAGVAGLCVNVQDMELHTTRPSGHSHAGFFD